MKFQAGIPCTPFAVPGHPQRIFSSFSKSRFSDLCVLFFRLNFDIFTFSHSITPDGALNNIGLSSVRWDTIYTYVLDVDEDVFIGDDLAVGGNTTIDGNLDVAGTIASGGITVTGKVLPVSDLYWDLGSSTKQWSTIYADVLELYGQANVWGIAVDQDATIGDDLDVGDALSVGGNATIDGNLYVDFDGGADSRIYFGPTVYMRYVSATTELYFDDGGGIGEMWHGANDGSGSTLDADFLDGKNNDAFSDSGHVHLEIVNDFISAAEAYNSTATLSQSLNHPVLLFDPDTDEYSYWGYRIHDNLSGTTCTLTVTWNSGETPSPTEYVYWKGQAYYGGNGQSHSTHVHNITNNSALPATANVFKEDTEIITSVAGGDIIGLLYYRDANDGTDTADSDARIHGISFKYPIEGKRRDTDLGQ